MKIKVKYINTNNIYYKNIKSIDQAIEIIRVQDELIASYRINSMK